MVWVRPGVLLVFAILSATSELIRLDLPTLERPRNAISGALGAGNCLGSAADVTKRVKTFMLSLWLEGRERARRHSPTPLPPNAKSQKQRAYKIIVRKVAETFDLEAKSYKQRG